MANCIIKRLPDDFLSGLPEEDQQAIQAAVGLPAMCIGYDEHTRAEVEFRDSDGNIHTIWLDPVYLTTT